MKRETGKESIGRHLRTDCINTKLFKTLIINIHDLGEDKDEVMKENIKTIYHIMTLKYYKGTLMPKSDIK